MPTIASPVPNISIVTGSGMGTEEGAIPDSIGVGDGAAKLEPFKVDNDWAFEPATPKLTVIKAAAKAGKIICRNLNIKFCVIIDNASRYYFPLFFFLRLADQYG